MTDWFSRNREAIKRRLAWLRDAPNGILFEKPSGLHRIVIHRNGEMLRMCFVDSAGTADELTWNGAMSVLRLDDPLDLSPQPYSQGFMLALLWRSRPKRIFVAGFGGGRIPLVLHHYFPEALIDSTDVDPGIADLARKYFGVEYDDRQRLFISDAREYLEASDSGVRYDLVFIDAFSGRGVGPSHLATTGFYGICRTHLASGGVVAVNLVEDEGFGPRLAAMAASFKHTYVHSDRTTVVFGTDGPELFADDFIRRAEAVQREHGFAFDLIGRASLVNPLRNVDRLRVLLQGSVALTDAPDSSRCACGN